VGVLSKRLELAGDKGQMQAEGLFDTGASYSFIRRDEAAQLATLLPLVRPLSFETAEEEHRLTATHVVRLEFSLNGHTFSDEFIVLDRLSEPVIIGAATMQKWRMKLDMEHEEVVIDPSVTRLRLI
jgi:hypothetical protein